MRYPLWKIILSPQPRHPTTPPRNFLTIPVRRSCPSPTPEPLPASGVPVRVEAQRQSRVGDVWTLSGDVVIHYRDYIVRADKIIYHQSTSELEAEGRVQVTGGPEDVVH